VANARDINLLPKLAKSDSFYQLKSPDQTLTYLTKQSGKELDWKKLSDTEKGMFVEAKIIEINNLVNSNAIKIETDKATIARIMEEYPHRIMPSPFIFTKKAGEVGENWKAKARWTLHGHKDPDSLGLERYAPTHSSTTVMLCLQVISSMRFRLLIVDVSSAQIRMSENKVLSLPLESLAMSQLLLYVCELQSIETPPHCPWLSRVCL